MTADHANAEFFAESVLHYEDHPTWNHESTSNLAVCYLDLLRVVRKHRGVLRADFIDPAEDGT